jgi:hypothetical protein
MRVPAFARGRNTIAGTVGLLDFNLVKGDRVDDAHPLLTQPDPDATRQHTLTWTVDDLLCHGIAWWRVLSTDAGGYPTHARRVAPSRVVVDATAKRIYLDGERIDPAELIRFDGPHEGVLHYGADTIRVALALEHAVKRYADNPEPTSVLYDKRPEDKLLKSWVDKSRGGGPRWLNRSVGYERLSFTPNELDLTAARQQGAVQIARMLGMPSRQVNAPSESGMTYQNVAADRQEVIDTTCALYIVALEQRLSMADVTRHGWAAKADRDAYAAGTLAERISNAAKATAAGLITRDEARLKYLGLGPYPAPTAVGTEAAPTDPDTQENP